MRTPSGRCPACGGDLDVDGTCWAAETDDCPDPIGARAEHHGPWHDPDGHDPDDDEEEDDDGQL